MKQVEFWRWNVVDDGVPKQTRYRMTRVEAEQRFPGATAVPGSLEMRNLPESPDEWNTAGFPRQAYDSTPKEHATMADDLKNRGPADRTRVNVNEAWEVRYWTQKFGCTEAELRRAVQAVGVMADKVEQRLKNKLA